MFNGVHFVTMHFTGRHYSFIDGIKSEEFKNEQELVDYLNTTHKIDLIEWDGEGSEIAGEDVSSTCCTFWNKIKKMPGK